MRLSELADLPSDWSQFIVAGDIDGKPAPGEMLSMPLLDDSERASCTFWSASRTFALLFGAYRGAPTKLPPPPPLFICCACACASAASALPLSCCCCCESSESMLKNIEKTSPSSLYMPLSSSLSAASRMSSLICRVCRCGGTPVAWSIVETFASGWTDPALLIPLLCGAYCACCIMFTTLLWLLVLLLLSGPLLMACGGSPFGVVPVVSVESRNCHMCCISSGSVSSLCCCCCCCCCGGGAACMNCCDSMLTVVVVARSRAVVAHSAGCCGCRGCGYDVCCCGCT